uniref:C2H2-type domain-containing protein n=1 Tax=Branchiostoma floridae TaxID=7739 RepID=C3YFJ5_BRAFL|eukprot:XP_002604948.1 hypothetical protein BRAFLDRAFT_92588 [Branchiostoma floridae]
MARPGDDDFEWSDFDFSDFEDDFSEIEYEEADSEIDDPSEEADTNVVAASGHGKKLYPCDECDKKYERAGNLSRHKREKHAKPGATDASQHRLELCDRTVHGRGNGNSGNDGVVTRLEGDNLTITLCTTLTEPGSAAKNIPSLKRYQRLQGSIYGYFSNSACRQARLIYNEIPRRSVDAEMKIQKRDTEKN